MWSSKKTEKILAELHCELRESLREYECEFVHTGKKSRPLLLILAYELCKDLGCGDHRFVFPAAAVELLHKFTLLHDDIVDRDDFRRGLPTFHLKYGLNNGVIFGDILASSALLMLVAKDVPLRCFKELTKAFRYVSLGKLRELSAQKKGSLEDYCRVIYEKGCSLLEAAAVIGGILAKADEKKLEKLRTYARNLGFAAQIINDIKDTIGWEKKKECVGGTDIWEGKWNYVLINTINTLEPSEREAMLELMVKRKKDEKDVKLILEFVEKTKSVEKAKRVAEAHLKSARENLEIFPASDAKNILNNVATFSFFDRYW